MIDRTSTPKAVSVGDIIYDEKQTGKYFKIIETFEKVVFNVKKNIVYSNDTGKTRKYRKLCIRIANAYGYKDEKTKDKIDLVALNLTNWQENCYKLNDLNHKRFWQAVNKLQRLLYGKCF